MRKLVYLCLLLSLWLGPWPAFATPAPRQHSPATALLPADRFSVSVPGLVTPSEAQILQQAGVQLVRVELLWSQVQPTSSSMYDWTIPDASLAALAAQNLDVLLVVGGNPAWAASAENGPVDQAPIAVYYNFVTVAAQRYGGAPFTVREWEIYNEPDAVQAWGNQAAGYAAVLEQDAQIIKSVAPAAAVVIGGLGYDNFTEQGGPFVRSFFPNLLAAGAGASMDAVNFHHYPSASSSWPSLQALVDSLQATMAAAGVQKPLIWSETGASSDPFWQGSLALQAAYVPKVYAGILRSGIQSASWFPLHDFDDPTYGYFARHGLLALDGTPKPAYTAYQVAAGYLSSTTFLRPQAAGELGGNPTATGSSMRRADGRGLIVAWSDNGAASESWPAGHVQAVTDKYGQPVSYSVGNGQITVPLTDPVYIELDKPARFADVDLDFWGQPFIEALAQAGAVGGYADYTFRPFNNATRGQISKMVVLALGWSIDSSAGQVFSDVPPTSGFYGVVETAYGHGIISGYACGAPGEPCDDQNRPYFRPNNNVTRGQLSKMLTVAKGWAVVPAGSQDFDDVPATHPFYGFIEAAFQHQVVSGYADRTFRPGSNATRAQLAKMIEAAV
ncbi:MAG TPA: S-layer homology domain-containing protein, partial [Chloroflexia bacterium]|nr:S-layer homology domain-containing protein [Chloroflexia bacterium]